MKNMGIRVGLFLVLLLLFTIAGVVVRDLVWPEYVGGNAVDVGQEEVVPLPKTMIPLVPLVQE
ncbi:MAG: hypothetical protein M3220_05520 [Chloroflexota bacterium]|nr:hypothetical protein [Chloroflexota bacterium]